MRASLKNPIILWLFVFVVWGIYRMNLRLPEEADEFIVKPLVWLGAVLITVKFIEKRSLSTIGWLKENIFKDLYLGWGLGAFFAIEGMIANAVKHRGLLFLPLGLSLFDLLRLILISMAVGFTEETLFRGYIFTRLREGLKNVLLANILSSLAFMAMHIPIAVFVLQYDLSRLISYGFIIFVLGIANGFIYTKTERITAPAISHALWNLSVLLFR